LTAKADCQVHDQLVVILAGTSHREHLAIAVLALVFGLALDFQVFFECEERFRLRGHKGLS
jgi:hypothetical protein